MLPTKENGDIISIENVFHSLNTRLISILNGNLEMEYGYNPNESIYEVEKQIFGFPAGRALNEINYSLGLIDRVQESKNNVVVENSDSNTNLDENSWSNYTKENKENKPQEIEEELNHYYQSLEKIQNELLVRLNSTEIQTNATIEKVPINIGIEEFAGLIYFLYKKDIFKIKYKPLCRKIVSLFSLKSGEQMTLDSLHNKGYESVNNGDVVNFWKAIFSDYIKQSYLLPKK